MRLLALAALAVAAVPGVARGDQTVGLFLNHPDAYPGYTLWTPLDNPTTYLVDMDGRKVHEWPGTAARHGLVYLLDDGNLLRTGSVDPLPANFASARGASGLIEEVDWDGSVVWSFTLANDQYILHHDIERLPNGNVLAIAWEYRSDAEAIAAGRDPAQLSDGALWPDAVFEIEPASNNIVWEWRAWDHLVQDFDNSKPNFDVVADRPERIDLNYILQPIADWNHSNAIAYNPEFDQVMLSVRSFSELWVIDHSTTTVEAAGSTGGRQGKGGDLLYRWGNPEAYDHGTAADAQLYFQHNTRWIPAGLPGAGNITLFNNGPRPTVSFSSADELTPPVDGMGSYAYTAGIPYGPTLPTWSFVETPSTDFYAQIISGAQRLPNGNTLIDEGTTGRFFEVKPDGTKVWEYVNPVTDAGRLLQGDAIPPSPSIGLANRTHRAERYPLDHPGLLGRDLTPTGPLELDVLLRNADLVALDPPSPALPAIFTGAPPVTLDPVRDEHVRGFASDTSDDLTPVCAAPLVFYQLVSDSDALQLVKDGPCSVRLRF